MHPQQSSSGASPRGPVPLRIESSAAAGGMARVNRMRKGTGEVSVSARAPRVETGGNLCENTVCGRTRRGEGRERLELPRCRQQFCYPHPPSPLSEHNAQTVRGRGLGQRCRRAGPNRSQPYLVIVHITNRTAPQARQKIPPGLDRHTALWPRTRITSFCMQRAVRPLVSRKARVARVIRAQPTRRVPPWGPIVVVGCPHASDDAGVLASTSPSTLRESFTLSEELGQTRGWNPTRSLFAT